MRTSGLASWIRLMVALKSVTSSGMNSTLPTCSPRLAPGTGSSPPPFRQKMSYHFQEIWPKL